MTLDVSLTAPRWSVSAMTRSMKAKGILMTSYTMEKNSNYSLCLFSTEAKAGSEKIKLCVRRYCWRLHLLRQRRCSQHCCFTCFPSASFDGSRRCQPSDGMINERHLIGVITSHHDFFHGSAIMSPLIMRKNWCFSSMLQSSAFDGGSLSVKRAPWAVTRIPDFLRNF